MKVLLAALLAVSTMFGISAQKFKPVPTFLKGEQQINVIFDYSKIKFDKDAQNKYYEYKGKEWVEEWEGKRKEANESYFISTFNQETSKIGLMFGSYPEAQYTLIVDVLNCDFGAYAGPFSVPAKIKGDMQIVKTGTSETLSIAATFKEKQNPYSVIGTPVDFDRISLAFGELAEEVGETLVKALKK